MTRHAKLISKDDPGTSYPLEHIEEREYVIGRADECDIQLVDGFVSRQQARLFYENGRFVLENKGSNPIFVNGDRVDRHSLADNDRITLGKTELVFSLEESTGGMGASQDSDIAMPAEERTVLISSPSPAESGPRLLIVSSRGEGSVYPLKTRRLLIGRSLDADLRLDDPSVSRKHCVIEKDKDSFVIKSLTYTNPVLFGDQPANERPLSAGDRFRIGSYDVTFLSEESEPARSLEDQVVLRKKGIGVFVWAGAAILVLCAVTYGLYRWTHAPQASPDRLKLASQQIENGNLDSAQEDLAALLNQKLDSQQMQKVIERLGQIALLRAEKLADAGNVKDAQNVLAAFIAKYGAGEQSKTIGDRLDLYRLKSAQELEASGDHLGALRDFSAITEDSPYFDEAQQAVSRIWLTYQQQQRPQLPIHQLLEEANEHFQAKRYTTPPNKNAYIIYQMILTLDPYNIAARERISQMKDFYRQNGDKYLQQRNYAAAFSYFERYALIDPNDPEIKEKVAQCLRNLRREVPSPRSKSSGAQDRREDRIRDLLTDPASPNR